MKTITERDGKNVNMQVVGDLHQYPDGSVHTVKNGKDVWEEGDGGSGGVEDYEVTPVVVMGTESDPKIGTESSATIYLYFDGLRLSEMEPNLKKGARIHTVPTQDLPGEFYLYMTMKAEATIFMATVVESDDDLPRILLFHSGERVEGAYFSAEI